MPAQTCPQTSDRCTRDMRPGQRLIYKEIFLFIQKTQTLQLLTHNLFVFFWAKFGKTVGDTDVQLFGAVDNRLSF